ncbi:hypothetical protein IAT38_005659 [Cryptococcus sp. DSM 104549]
MRRTSPTAVVGDNDARTAASARPSIFAGCFAFCYADEFDDISHDEDGEAPETSSRAESGAGGIVGGLQDVRARMREEMRQDRWNMERETAESQALSTGGRATGLRTRPSFDEHYAMRMRRGLSIVQEDFEEDENGEVQFRTSTPVRAQKRQAGIATTASESSLDSSLSFDGSDATITPTRVTRPPGHMPLSYSTAGPSTSNAMPPRLPPLAFLSSPSRKQPHTLRGQQIDLGGEEDGKME